MPPTSFSACWADFFYLAYRTVVILGSMLLLALCALPDDPKPIFPPENVVTKSEQPADFTNLYLAPEQHAELVRKVHGSLRMLRLVLERIPKHFTPYRQEPGYKLTYYVERLECGHERMYFPQAGPMTRRRHCASCALAASLPEKKPSSSVLAPLSSEQEKQA